MDKYNIITPTDNLDDLTNDMVNWYQMPKNFRDLFCIAKRLQINKKRPYVRSFFNL